jgi:iron complex transport system substrate-binding protein
MELKGTHSMENRGGLAAFVLAIMFFQTIVEKLAIAEEMPQRIVSIHLCADQFTLALANRAQIASLSYLATDESRSYMANAAKGIQLNNGTAEEVVALRPDLVLAGFMSARATIESLQTLGYRVLELALSTNFDDIRAQIQLLADILGNPKKGKTLIAKMDQQLETAVTDIYGSRPLAAIYQPMGFTSGRGSLESSILISAGFENLAVRLKMGALGHLPLETLISARPSLLVNWMGDDPHPSLSRAGYAHPVLAKGPWQIAFIPNKLWSCGAWYSALAVKQLAAIRRSLKK